MLAFLWRVLIAVSALWLIGKYLGYLFPHLQRGARRDGKGTGSPASNRMVKDPVCGMYIDPRLALPLDVRGETVYFCSEECRGKHRNDSTAD
jgi:YHS domain-containing protein